MSKKTLILSYTFPPMPGIGGRRWAKFAKYLHRDFNHEIFILCNEYQGGKASPWLKDTANYRSTIYHFQDNYPKIINKESYSFLEKILYRIVLRSLKAKVKGNYYDRTSLLGNSFLNEVIALVKKNQIKNLIVSAGPFYWTYLLSTLKSQLPGVQFIADFRDPWTNNKTAFGFASLSSERLHYEKELECIVASSYDYVISVSDDMTDYFKGISLPISKTRYLTIKNGFDKDDFSPVEKKAASTKLRFLFAGTLYNKSEYLIEELATTLKKLKANSPDIYKNMEFNFIGEVPGYFSQHFKEIHQVKYKGSVSLEKVYHEINESDVCMLFLTQDLGYSLSTKFYEYLSQHKTIAVFSKEGKTGNFVEANNLGYALNYGNIDEDLLKIYNDWKSKQLRVNEKFDITTFDVQYITKSIADILI